jgi:hypothetical protein
MRICTHHAVSLSAFLLIRRIIRSDLSIQMCLQCTHAISLRFVSRSTTFGKTGRNDQCLLRAAVEVQRSRGGFLGKLELRARFMFKRLANVRYRIQCGCLWI